MSYFVRTDAGRSKSKRPRQDNDCTVRALAVALHVAYDVAYDELKARGRKSHRGVFFPNRAADDEVLGVQLRWVPFPARKGQRRVTPETFVSDGNGGRHGTWIIKTAKHVACVRDGHLYDLDPQVGRCVYGAWEVCGTATAAGALAEGASP